MASEGKTGFGATAELIRDHDEIQPYGNVGLNDFGGGEGGLATVNGNAVSILPWDFRKDEERDHRNEHNILAYNTGDPERILDADDMSKLYPGLGTEMEVNVVGSDGQPSNAQRAVARAAKMGEPLGYGVSPELWNFTIEIGTNQPAATPREQREQIARALILMDDSLDRDQMLLPTSTLPGYDTDWHRDITDHPYIRRMAGVILGRKNTENFTAVGPQLHVETPSHLHGARALMWSENPFMILKALAQSSPYDGTELHYDVRGRLANLPDNIPNDGKWVNLRDPQRKWGLGTGGVARHWPNFEAFVIPEEFDKFVNYRNRETFPDRAFGGHTKRQRVTLGGAPTGTLEVPDFDSAGYRVERLSAINEVATYTVRAMMQLDPLDFEQQERLAEKYPAVFHPMRSDKDITRLVKIANRNEFRLARKGKNAGIAGSDYQIYNIGQALTQLYDFCQEMNGVIINDAAKYELAQGLKEPARQNPVEHYYRTGQGTLTEAYRAEVDKIEFVSNDKNKLLAVNRLSAGALKSYIGRMRAGLEGRG